VRELLATLTKVRGCNTHVPLFTALEHSEVFLFEVKFTVLLEIVNFDLCAVEVDLDTRRSHPRQVVHPFLQQFNGVLVETFHLKLFEIGDKADFGKVKLVFTERYNSRLADF
jgi:hypothetical protein